MTVCLVLGSAACLQSDLAAYRGPRHGVVACNDAGVTWPGQLDAWVSLHAPRFRDWTAARDALGHPPSLRLIGHRRNQFDPRAMPGVEFTDHLFPEQSTSGSSGLFAAKVALVDLGFDRVVLCGVPMTSAPHFFDHAPWADACELREGWRQVPDEWAGRMSSMSGWTRQLLGRPFHAPTQGDV